MLDESRSDDGVEREENRMRMLGRRIEGREREDDEWQREREMLKEAGGEGISRAWSRKRRRRSGSSRLSKLGKCCAGQGQASR